MNGFEKEKIFIERTRREYPWVWETYREMIACEAMSVDELHDYNWRHRLTLLRFAYDQCPFYRELYDAHGIDPRDVKTEEDWRRLPVVTKDMARARGADMVARDLTGRLVRETVTGGSTGMPVAFKFDHRARGPAVDWRFRGWWLGREPGRMECAVPIIGVNEALVRRTRGLGAITPEELKRRSEAIRPMRLLILDSRDLTLENVRAFDLAASEDGVYYLQGYPEAVTELARIYERGDIVRGNWNPSVVYAGGSVFTNPMRRLVAEVFGRTPREVYGSNECAVFAATCPEDDEALHVYADRVHLELLDERNEAVADGEEGRTVITVLHERVMPLIRYDQGDCTRFLPGVCSCGLRLPRIGRISGRVDDCLIAADGSRIAGLSSVFDDCPACVRQFRYVQEKPGEATVEVVPTSTAAEVSETIRRAVTDAFATSVERLTLTVRFVDRFPYVSDKCRIVFRSFES